jgi:hypothetical protein
MAGTLVLDTIQDGSGNSTSATNSIRGSAKAWCRFNFNGTILSSFNISSITSPSQGEWVINFTTGMPNNQYAIMAFTTDISGGVNLAITNENEDYVKTNSSFGILSYYGGYNQPRQAWTGRVISVVVFS